MAVQGSDQRLSRFSATTLWLWLAAFTAAGLSLAAALLAVFGGGTTTASQRSLAQNELGARNERIAFFEARAANDPLDFVSLNVLAGNYLQRARESGDVADFQRADMAATRSLEIVPRDNHGGLVNLASVRLAQHDFAVAAEIAQRSIDLKPSNPAGYGLLGDALIASGKYQDAGKAYDRMLALERALPSLSRQADLAWLQGDLVNAEDFWKQALRFDDGLPTENRAWVSTQLGGLYFAKGDLKKAEAEYERALQMYPEYLHAQAGLGAVRAAQARWEEAIDFYKRATAQLPVPQYVASLGDVYAAAGRMAEAETQYALVEVIDSLYRANGINNDQQLAMFYADHDRRLDEALAMAQAAYDAAPGIYATDALAWALFKNNRLEEADAKMKEALRLGTPDPLLHFHAATISKALGNRAVAREHARRLQEVNASFSPLHTKSIEQLVAQLQSESAR